MAISNDPIGFNAGDANLYRYVGNKSTTRTDPSGLEWFDLADGFRIRADRGEQIRGGFEIHVYRNGVEKAKLTGFNGWCQTHSGKKLMSPKDFREQFPDVYRQLRGHLQSEAKRAYNAGWRPSSQVSGRKVTGNPPASSSSGSTRQRPPRNSGNRPGFLRFPAVKVPQMRMPQISPKLRGATAEAGPLLALVFGEVALSGINDLVDGGLGNVCDNTIGEDPSDMMRNMNLLFGSDWRFHWSNLTSKSGHGGYHDPDDDKHIITPDRDFRLD